MRVAVIGGGRMGAGIAQVFLAAGDHVTVQEPQAEAARWRIAEGLAIAESKGLVGRDEALTRLAVAAGTAAGVPADADLVIEAVPEDAALKVQVLAEAEATVGDDAVLATNTSSLSIAELGSALDRPERLIGLHFFNPVPVQRLVEIVVTGATPAAVLDRARGHVERIGKASVVVNDSPGFATSRLGVLLGLEAIRMVEEGVASAEDIDTAMTLGYGHPMGPLKLSDLVGLDVRLAIAGYLHARLGPRFEPPALLREKVAAGELGRKTGKGFYQW
ncbi:3-hydroxyacyl-CoA dehydrogenase family protein [Nonomuraea diastatica]|uniref:3-hydroxyacyl-CoA dehydrogenase family protein n=1 Tax=Nonomuraea diastatica TaxID=1848329 RepID=A0A4R4WMS7_9ACTN|nr:3-hydroxyacyl-CoA dehydrogenase family protein [Nonomuraea diastatica]TDD15130.1 3-hydroxyacyl-CoA dehydrogenase family protein [Nonomuraea diastatica]